MYLNCQLTDSKSGKVTRINITLDEATKQVSLVLVDHGLTESTTGIFNPDTVFFVSPKSSGTIAIQYSINRISLSLQQRVRIDAGQIIEKTDLGKCSIVQAPKNRKF